MSQQKSQRGRRRNNSGGQPLLQQTNNSPFTWQQQEDILNQASNRKSKGYRNPQHNQGGSSFTKVYTNSAHRGGGGELQNLLNGLPNARQSSEKPYQKRRGSQPYNNNGVGTKQSESMTFVDQAAEDEAIRLNSAALRRIDSDFLKLHGTASQVAVYRFNPETQSWDKTNTVGCLLLYERTSDPRYGLVVMNRKNANNFIQWFGSDAQVVLQMPHLLLRNVQDRSSIPVDGIQPIHCIWFYDTHDCLAAADILKNMGLQFEGESTEQARYKQTDKSVSQGQAAGNALFQILQKNNKDKSKNEGGGARILTAEELESQMLDEADSSEGRRRIRSYSGSASSASGLSSLLGISQPREPDFSPVLGRPAIFTDLGNLSRAVDEIGNQVNRPLPTSAGIMAVSHASIAQSLGAQNKMRTVEQLERDMKDESSNSGFDVSNISMQNDLIETLGLSKSGTPIRREELSGSTPSRHMERLNRDLLLSKVIGKCVDDVSQDDMDKLLKVIDPSSLILVTQPVPGETESRLVWKLNRNSSMRKDNDSTFTTPSGEFVSASATRCSSQQGSGTSGTDAKFGDYSSCEDQKPSPLTERQLQQALIHLLKTDSDFVNKLHRCYLQSLDSTYHRLY